MHPNLIPARMKADLDALEARVDARLDALRDGLDRLLTMAGLPPTDRPAVADARADDHREPAEGRGSEP